MMTTFRYRKIYESINLTRDNDKNKKSAELLTAKMTHNIVYIRNYLTVNLRTGIK